MKDGLSDREPGVRVAAGKLVASWFDMAMVEAPKMEERTSNGDDDGVMKGLIHFLGLFDVAGPGEAVAVDAALSILTIRPDIDVFTFEGSSADHLPSVKCISDFSCRSLTIFGRNYHRNLSFLRVSLSNTPPGSFAYSVHVSCAASLDSETGDLLEAL